MKDDDKTKDLVNRAVDLLAGDYARDESFNSYFDGDQPIKVPSPLADVGEYTYPRSKVLFWVDRDAYADEQAAWQDQTIQRRHDDALKLLARLGLGAEFGHVVEAVQRNRVVPFVGAGLSKAMGYPLWGAALAQIRGRLGDFDSTAFDAAVATGDLLLAAQCLFDHDQVAVTNFIKTSYGRHTPSGPASRLPDFCRGCIVTTNFDRVIEDVFLVKKMHLDAYMHGSQHHNFFARLARGDRCILKLHGDAETAATHVFTKKQYESEYGVQTDFSKPLPKALRQVFIGHSLLFLGCSLEADRTLAVFHEVKQDHFEIPGHYAILEEPPTPARKASKESHLLKCGIQPFWYPHGEHAFVEKMLALLVDLAEGRMPLRILERTP